MTGTAVSMHQRSNLTETCGAVSTTMLSLPRALYRRGYLDFLLRTASNNGRCAYPSSSVVQLHPVPFSSSTFDAEASLETDPPGKLLETSFSMSWHLLRLVPNLERNFMPMPDT